MSNAKSFAGTETPAPDSVPEASDIASEWDAGRISDECYRTKFIDAPRLIEEWMAGHGGLAGRDILDYGCGDATTALAIALRHAPRRLDALDAPGRAGAAEACGPLAAEQLGLMALPPNLRLAGAPRDEIGGPYDVIYSWSGLGRVDQPLLPGAMRALRAALKPDGVALLHAAPLFYSMDGAELMRRGADPWAHLTTQHDVYLDLLAAACASTEEFVALQSAFESLNRLTADQLIAHARGAGFEVLREHRAYLDSPPPPALAAIYQPVVLLNDRITLLLRPTRA